MKASLAPPGVHFTSSFVLRVLLNSMHNSLGPKTWKAADVTLSGSNVPFFYRNPLACVEYLMQQRAHRSDMVFAPERLYYISKKFNLPPGHLIYLMPRMSKIVTRIQAAPVTHLVPPGAPSWHPISSETFCD